MPNHVANIVIFEGDDVQIQKMLSEVQNEEFANDLWDSFQNPNQQHDMEMGI